MSKRINNQELLKTRLLAILAGLPADDRKAIIADLREVAETISALENDAFGLPGVPLVQSPTRRSLSKN